MIIGVYIFILTTGNNMIVGAAAVNASEAPEQVLKRYCQEDFSDVVLSTDDVRVSPEYKKFIDAMPGGDEPLSLTGDPIIIVSTYYVSGVQVDGNSGIGKVIFERLAYTRGSGAYAYANSNPTPREIIPEYNESEVVEYKLRRIDNKWYVYDPPVVPRLSIAILVNHYVKTEVSDMLLDFWPDPTFSIEHRKNMTKPFHDMGVLMRISEEYLERVNKRYEKFDDPGKELEQRVKSSYTGKWNVVMVPESK